MTDERSSLAKALQSSRPFRSPAQEASLGLARTWDALRRSLSDALAPSGLTLQQFNVLRILRGAGATPLPTLTIADRMVERTPGVTRILDRLEATGLVERERCPDDRRRVLIRITPRGLEALDRADGPLADAEERAFVALDRESVDTLASLLERVRLHLEGPPDSRLQPEAGPRRQSEQEDGSEGVDESRTDPRT